MILITLTRAGKVIGKHQLYDLPDNFSWAIIELAFANENIRTITRTNDEWRVDLAADATKEKTE